MESLRLVARDGYALTSRIHGAQGPVVVVAGATGVPQRFYRAFGSGLADAGFTALTFDYRGIGESRPASLKGFVARGLDWAELDLNAAVDWALTRGPTLVVGHSYGGQAYGLVSRVNETLGLFAVGTGAGWTGYMPPLEQVKVGLFWNVLGPVSTSLKGYLPKAAWGGEDLPLGVYRDWRTWCSSPTYWFADPSLGLAERVAKVTRPITALNTPDDAWASPRAAEVFFSHFSGAPTTLLAPTSASLGHHQVRHLDYLRPGRESVWKNIIE